MGWWEQNEQGESFADNEGGLMWGDGPADAIDVALRTVVAEFQEGLGRPPTADELIAGVRFSMPGKGIVLASGVRYCECESPVMDPEHDEGCRRCGLPVNFAPQRQTITHPSDTAGLYDLSVTAGAMKAAGESVTAGECMASVELRLDQNAMLVVSQGDEQAIFDNQTGRRVDAEAEPSADEQRLAMQDSLISGVLDHARRVVGEISDWSVKAELEDGVEVLVTFASGACSLYRAQQDREPYLVWAEPADSPRTVRLVAPAPTAAQAGLVAGPFAREAERVGRFVDEHPQLHRDLALSGERVRELAGRRVERGSVDVLHRGWFLSYLRAASPPGFDYTADEELALILVTHALQAIENERDEEDDGHNQDRAATRVVAAFECIYGLR